MEPGPTPTFTASAPSFDQLVRGLASRDVACHDGHVWEVCRFSRRTVFSITFSEWPCAVSTTNTSHPHRDQLHRALFRVLSDPDCRPDPKPTLRIERRIRELDLFLDILDGDESTYATLFVDDWQLFDPVAMEDFLGFLEGCAEGYGDEACSRSLDHTPIG